MMLKMVEIIKIERKRVLNSRVFLMFLILVFLFSAYSARSALKRYHVPNVEGIAVTWQENLKHAKTKPQEKSMNQELLRLMRKPEGQVVYLDEWNLEEMAAANYEGKSIRDLSVEDIGNFYVRRLSNIRTMLEENQNIHYTKEEIEDFMQRAEQFSDRKIGYAEGWKVLNDDMGIFIPALLILIALFLLPLFGADPKNNSNELYRAAKYGKKPLDHARILTAFMIGIVLYLLGIILFFFIKMLPFGLEGWNQCIQGNAGTLFSLYNITNLQQFLLNATIGLAALLFVVSLVLLITVVMEKIMASAVVFAFFWILLLLFEQMHLWPVNHYFANFMPLRMTSFSHYYVGNEIYRVSDFSLSCMAWSITVSGLLAGMMLAWAAGWERIKRKRGLY